MKRIVALMVVAVVILCFGSCLDEEVPSENNQTIGDTASDVDGKGNAVVEKNQNNVEPKHAEGIVALKDKDALTEDELGKIFGEWKDVPLQDKPDVKNRIYTNDAAGLVFKIPAENYASGKRWVCEDVVKTKNSGLIPVMLAKKVVQPDETVDNVSVYMEKVEEGTTPEAYINDVFRNAKMENTLSAPQVDKSFFISDSETDVANEAWSMIRNVENAKSAEKALQKVIAYRKGEYMVTIIITSKEKNLDIISKWFSLMAVD